MTLKQQVCSATSRLNSFPWKKKTHTHKQKTDWKINKGKRGSWRRREWEMFIATYTHAHGIEKYRARWNLSYIKHFF